jgi:hypothetical protein
MQLLRQVLAAHGVPAEVQQCWIDHDMALSGQITGDGVGECND